jgi:hypothetical protein
MLGIDTCSVGVNTTVNIQNAYYIPELLDWADDVGIHYHSLNLLVLPAYLSLSNVMPGYVKPTIEKLKTYKDQSKVQHIIDCLEQSNPTDGDEFFSYMDYKDKIRNEKFSESHPEVSAILKK